MQRSRPNFAQPLRLIAILSIVAPAIIFSYATAQNWRSVEVQANERLERALDVLQEHALKALQTVERSISEVNEVLRGMPDETIRERESDLYLRLKRTQQALPQMESIWAFDKDGHPLVSSTIYPVPRNLNNSDRAYFAAQKLADAGTYIGEVVRARVGAMRFFVVSGRRTGNPPGTFNGVIGVTVMPEHFSEFYRKLARGRDAFALMRSDGMLLARYPEADFEGVGMPPELLQAIRERPESGMMTFNSKVDGVERKVAYHRVPGYPLYVAAGIETGALSHEFWSTTLTGLALGFPVVLLVFGLSLYSAQRAQRFEEEAARREAAEAALKQAQRLEAVGQLTGGVAHDFNNLLMVVDGNIQRIKRLAANVPARNIEAIEIAVKRGANLTRQLLSFSRRQTHESRVIDLHERLPVIREMLQSSLRGDIVVETDVAPDLWNVKVDVSELELSLLNLAVNARDAMSAGGFLTISARNQRLSSQGEPALAGDFVALGIKDSGAGIPPDLLNRVFEPFFTTKDVGKGTGLGLSQVYGFAQQAGGTATIDSVVGKGTTVTLYLPRSTEPVESKQDAGDSATRAQSRSRGEMLLVEDNAEVANVTRMLLEECGYSAHVVNDATTAKQFLSDRNVAVDLVLSDIVMPGGISGLDLARWIRKERSGLPVILATGYSERAQAAAHEGFTILRKPYDGERLREALAEIGKDARERTSPAQSLHA